MIEYMNENPSANFSISFLLIGVPIIVLFVIWIVGYIKGRIFLSTPPSGSGGPAEWYHKTICYYDPVDEQDYKVTHSYLNGEYYNSSPITYDEHADQLPWVFRSLKWRKEKLIYSASQQKYFTWEEADEMYLKNHPDTKIEYV
jgi:hypothetical protein